MLLGIGIVVKSDCSQKILQEGIAVKRDSGLKALRYGTIIYIGNSGGYTFVVYLVA